MIDPAFAKDPSIAAAKIKAYGPLANAMESQTDNGEADPPKEAPSETVNQQPGQTSASDLVGPNQLKGSGHFHGTFRVRSYKWFRVNVPPHSSLPKVHATFTSVSSDRTRRALPADVLVLDRPELDDFIHGAGGDTVFWHESESGVIDVTLDPTILDSKEYYVVFSSPDNRGRIITADLTATFD